MEILFVDKATGDVNFAVTGVTLVKYITPSEIGFATRWRWSSSVAFLHTEKIEVVHIS
jgi:hypothetical protein